MAEKKTMKNWIIGLEKKEYSFPLNWGRKFLELIYLWKREMQRDHSLQRSASLTYTTILAIFPLLAVIALFVPVFFGGMENIEQQIMDFVEKILIPQAGQDFEAGIRSYFEAFRRNATAVGIFGVIGLMVAAMLLFTNMEKSFNDIWQARSHRSMVAVFTRFTAVLVCVPLLIGLSIVLTAELAKRVEIVGRLFSLAVPFFITCTALTLSFFVLPNTSVKFRFALIGGLFSGLVWETAKVAFGYYMANPKIEIIYKSLGAIPIFLIWTYFTWLIILLGCELAFLLQNYTRLKRETFRIQPDTFLDSGLFLIVFLVIAEWFQEGRGGVKFGKLLEKIPVQTQDMEKILNQFKKTGLVSETDNGTFIPNQPLSRLKPVDVLKAGCRPDQVFSGEEPEDEKIRMALEEFNRNMTSWGNGATILDLVSEKSG